MGQSASRAARRASAAVQRSTASPVVKGTAPPVQQTATSHLNAPPIQSPSFATRPSARDAAQQKLMEEAKGTQFREMPDDLLNFLKDAGPLQSTKPSVDKNKSREPRLPRHLRDSEAPKLDRIQESMPLAAKIEGFETTHSTSFSRKTHEMNPKKYQQGNTLDMYRLLIRKPDMSVESIVDQTYKEYSVEFPLPSEDDQAMHKELLTNTLLYMELPTILKDTKDRDDSYDGVSPDQVEEYALLRYAEIPKTQVRLVLEDLNERDKNLA